MAEQFDVNLVEEAMYHMPRPECREKTLVGNHEEDTRRVLQKEG
jgi:hypothetical protein